MTLPPEQNSEVAAGDVLKKHLCWRFVITKLQAFRPAKLLKETPTQVFSYEIWEILKNTYFEEHLLTTVSVYIINWFLQFTTVHAFHFYK